MPMNIICTGISDDKSLIGDVAHITYDYQQVDDDDDTPFVGRIFRSDPESKESRFVSAKWCTTKKEAKEWMEGQLSCPIFTLLRK